MAEEDQRMPRTLEELRAFIREEVRRALHDEVLDWRRHTGGPRAYSPSRMETKGGDLPAWAQPAETRDVTGGPH